jgi:hypothetical protein
VGRRGSEDRAVGDDAPNPTDPGNLPVTQKGRSGPGGSVEERWVLDGPSVKGWAFDRPSVRKGG